VKLKSPVPHDELFRALGDRTRLRLMLLLREGEVCVCHLVNTLEESQPLVSKHLAILRRAGLVSSRKDGYWRHYSLAEPGSAAHAKLLALLDLVASEQPDAERDRKKLERVLAAAKCCD
jgi:ArsR family transcriptional regulator